MSHNKLLSNYMTSYYKYCFSSYKTKIVKHRYSFLTKTTDPTVYLHFCSSDHQEFCLPLFSASSVVSVLAVQSWNLFVAYFPGFLQPIWIVFLHLSTGFELLQLMTSFLKSTVKTEGSSNKKKKKKRKSYLHLNSHRNMLVETDSDW